MHIAKQSLLTKYLKIRSVLTYTFSGTMLCKNNPKLHFAILNEDEARMDKHVRSEFDRGSFGGPFDCK